MRSRLLQGTAACVAATAVVSGCSLLRTNNDDSRQAQLDTMVQYKVDQYVHEFPWSADMMTVLRQEGLLTSPQRVFELQTYFQMACVGGRDMLAGQSGRTAADLAAEFRITVSPEAAGRLNAAQQQLCTVMPLPTGQARPSSGPS